MTSHIECTLHKLQWKQHFTSVCFFNKTPYPSLIMKKNQTIPRWGTFYKVCDRYSWNLSRSSKRRKIWELSQPRGSKGNRITKCNVESWMGFWTQKMDVSKNEENLKYGLQLKIMYQYWFMNCHASTILTWEIDSKKLNVRYKNTLCPVFTTFP